MNRCEVLSRPVKILTDQVRWNLPRIVDGLRKVRDKWRSEHQRNASEREFPSPDALRDIAANLCGGLFPMRLGPQELRGESEDFYVGYTLDRALNALLCPVI